MEAAYGVDRQLFKVTHAIPNISPLPSHPLNQHLPPHPSTTTMSSDRVSRDRLIALPSLSGGLSNLPQANSMGNLALHPSMIASRAAESEAKLRRSLLATAASRNGSSSSVVRPFCFFRSKRQLIFPRRHQQPKTASSRTDGSSSEHLMMRSVRSCFLSYLT